MSDKIMNSKIHKEISAGGVRAEELPDDDLIGKIDQILRKAEVEGADIRSSSSARDVVEA